MTQYFKVVGELSACVAAAYIFVTGSLCCIYDISTWVLKTFYGETE